MAALLRYVRYLEAVGAPVDRFLAHAGIPANLLDLPEAIVPREAAFRFGEKACRALGTEHLGLYVGLASLREGLGAYGAILSRALTLQDYLNKGIRLYNMLITGQRLWLSGAGNEIRFNIATVGEASLAAYQSHLETLAVTIATTRNAAGASWSPREISLAFSTRESLPEIDFLAGSRVTRGTGETYFTIPRALMSMPLSLDNGYQSMDESPASGQRALPDDLCGLVELQLQQLLPERVCDVEAISESLMMSSRSLQRMLAGQGTTFSQVLAETRQRLAAGWLKATDKPIGEIAFELGYTDASNFTRAFRRQTGAPPQLFRDHARKR
jgi:AraC-like DNA-binding protein